MAAVTHVFFDIGGVLGTNGWDSRQRARVKARFGLGDDFDRLHDANVDAWETGRLTLDGYLDAVVFTERRAFSREEFAAEMLAGSKAFPGTIDVVRRVKAAGRVRLFTLNNESEALNIARIDRFGLKPLFEGFLSSCWLGIRKPGSAIYERALAITQAEPSAVLFVDDRAENLTPAAALGMRTWQFDGNEAALADALRAAGAL